MVVDTDECEQEVTATMLSDVLSDDKTYEKPKKHPTQKYKRKLVSIIRKLKEDDNITGEQCKYLYPTAGNVPMMHCTPKIHKPGNPPTIQGQ